MSIRELQEATALHRRGRLEHADRRYRRLLGQVGMDEWLRTESLHMHGVLLLQRQRPRAARKRLLEAVARTGVDPMAHYHLGEVHRAMGDSALAVSAYECALAHGVRHVDLYFAFGNALFDLGRHCEAVDRYREALGVDPTDTDCRLNLSNTLELLGQFDEAVAELVQIVPSRATSGALACQLVGLLARAGQSGEATRRALQIEWIHGDDSTLVLDIAESLIAHECRQAALHLLERLLEEQVYFHSDGERDRFHGMLLDLGRSTAVDARLAELQSDLMRSAASLFQQGLCSQAAGRYTEAAQLHRMALKRDAALGRAAYSLSANHDCTIADAELRDWEIQAESCDDLLERGRFLFAIARVLDRRKQTDAAWRTYVAGNRLMATRKPFDADAWDAYIDRLITTYSAEHFASLDTGADGDTLVFIVGMPRSGSTLLEVQLIERLGARGLGEHGVMRELFSEHGCRDLSLQAIDEARGRYLRSLPDQRHPLVLDKMLGNVLRLGLVATLFPRAKVLHATREAEPCCVSCFTNLFAHGLAFTYDLEGLGRAWRAYQRLMAHWREVLPLPMLDVHHERLAADPSLVFAEITEFLEHPVLPDQCRTDPVQIQTASFWQARQAISAESSTRWRRFESHLPPLARGLAGETDD